MPPVEIVLVALAGLIVLFFLGGLATNRRRERARAGEWEQRLAAADRALEQARASDRGWDRGMMEGAARQALAEHRPGWQPERLELVLVDDRPGVEEDRAHFMAGAGEEEMRIVLA